MPVGDQGTLLAVPAAAVQRVRDRWCVFIPRDNRTFEIRPVGRGRDIAGEVEILSGVRAGEPIVPTLRLVRSAIGSITLKGLQPGQWRWVDRSELAPRKS